MSELITKSDLVDEFKQLLRSDDFIYTNASKIAGWLISFFVRKNSIDELSKTLIIASFINSFIIELNDNLDMLILDSIDLHFSNYVIDGDLIKLRSNIQKSINKGIKEATYLSIYDTGSSLSMTSYKGTDFKNNIVLLDTKGAYLQNFAYNNLKDVIPDTFKSDGLGNVYYRINGEQRNEVYFNFA